jgi:hypothetical protein
MKEIDLGVNSKRSEQGDKNQSVQKFIPECSSQSHSPCDIVGSFLLEKEEKKKASPRDA